MFHTWWMSESVTPTHWITTTGKNQQYTDTVISENTNKIEWIIDPKELKNMESLGKWPQDGVDAQYLTSQLELWIHMGIWVLIRKNTCGYFHAIALTYIGKSHYSDKYTQKLFLKFKDETSHTIYVWNGKISEENQIFLRKKTPDHYESRDEYIKNGLTHFFLKIIIPKDE